MAATADAADVGTGALRDAIWLLGQGAIDWALANAADQGSWSLLRARMYDPAVPDGWFDLPVAEQDRAARLVWRMIAHANELYLTLSTAVAQTRAYDPDFNPPWLIDAEAVLDRIATGGVT